MGDRRREGPEGAEPTPRTPLRSVWEDTLGDKIVRFLLGALIGAPLACRYWGTWWPENDVQGWSLIVGNAVLFGLLAVLFGYRFFEWLVGGHRS